MFCFIATYTVVIITYNILQLICSCIRQAVRDSNMSSVAQQRIVLLERMLVTKGSLSYLSSPCFSKNVLQSGVGIVHWIWSCKSWFCSSGGGGPPPLDQVPPAPVHAVVDFYQGYLWLPATFRSPPPLSSPVSNIQDRSQIIWITLAARLLYPMLLLTCTPSKTPAMNQSR